MPASTASSVDLEIVLVGFAHADPVPLRMPMAKVRAGPSPSIRLNDHMVLRPFSIVTG